MPLSKVARCIRLYKLLRSNVDFSIEQLAAMQCVSRRTVFRDLRLLEAAADELGQGTINVRASHLKPERSATLTVDEAMALALSAKISPLQDVPKLASKLNAGLAKLVGDFSDIHRAGLARLANACQAKKMAVPVTDLQQDTLLRILEALRSQCSLRLVIAGQPPIMTRFRPEQLIASADSWMVRGRSTWHRRRVELDLQSLNQAVILNN